MANGGYKLKKIKGKITKTNKSKIAVSLKAKGKNTNILIKQ